MAKEQAVFLLAGLWRIIVLGCSFRYLGLFSISTFLVVAFYCNNREGRLLQTSHVQNHIGGGVVLFLSDSLPKNCNLFEGTWVYDNKSLPLYKDRNCSFMLDEFACEKYGRKDLDYQYWRWQPDHCDLQKFDAKALLHRLRNKRLVFVGDSLSRNQWVSVVCLIESSIPSGFKSSLRKGNLYTFNAKEYNATIDFYWAPFLVESNSDDRAKLHRLKELIVRVNSIEKHAKNWADADILLFNSFYWWKIATTLKISQESLENRANEVAYKEMDSRECYKKVLETWSKWVLRNGNKTRLFWMSMSPPHNRASNWGKADNDELKCNNETEPIRKRELGSSETNGEMMLVTERAVEGLKARGLNIQLINITGLSEYRKDGHPTIYKKRFRPLNKKQLANPLIYADCVHWCLPGIPDVWNHLLFTYLL